MSEGIQKPNISLEPTGVCKRCDNLIMHPGACFVKGTIGTYMVDAPYCKVRKLHYDYIRKIDDLEEAIALLKGGKV